jgi:protochlorophyllide reductase
VQLLLDHLVEPGRVVVVSSGVHYGSVRSLGFPGPRWRDPQVLADPAAQDLSPRAGRARYSTSKLANIYFTYELARRLEGRRITANVFDPGLMPATRLDRDYPSGVQRFYHLLTPLLIRLVPDARPVARSAVDLARMAMAPEFADVTGVYVSGSRRRATSKESYDRARAAALWAASTRLVAGDPPDTPDPDDLIPSR